MLSDEIRDLLRSLPAILVVEDGRPAYVVTQYEAWRQLANEQPVHISNGRPGHLSPRGVGSEDAQESQILERLNKEILSLRNQIQMQEDEVDHESAE